MSDCDEALLQQALDGDATALSTMLYRCTADLRARIDIDRKWASMLEPDDVLQVTFMEAFLRIRQFRPAGPGAFLSWLTQIAQNNLRDAIKELSRMKRPPPGHRLQDAARHDSATLLLDRLNITEATPSRSAAGHEIRAAVEKALLRMPEDYAVVIRLYDLEDRPIQEVAALLGRSPGAVHMLRSRAHEHLRDLLGAEAEYFSQTG